MRARMPALPSKRLKMMAISRKARMRARVFAGARVRALISTPEERAQKNTAGEPYAIRCRVPKSGVTKFEDAVFGPREVQNEEIEDFVLLRSNGLPTYQLSVVVDDIDMRISHVIRGADHLSNTPKQVLIYQGLGEKPPIFAHVPLILGPDRTRLSKRHGATSVTSYVEEGFLPEGVSKFSGAAGMVAGRRSGVLADARACRALLARRREPHQCRVRSRQARVVQRPISSEDAD